MASYKEDILFSQNKMFSRKSDLPEKTKTPQNCQKKKIQTRSGKTNLQEDYIRC